jgi:hypothetical protein
MRQNRCLKSIVAVAACLFGFSSALANNIPSRSNSNYGESGNPTTYTAVSSLNDLTGNAGTFVLDPTPPLGFNVQVLCPISTGCAPGGGVMAGSLRQLRP